MVHFYDISGMHCEACVEKVTSALKAVPGITSSSVTLNPPRASVQMDRHVSMSVLNDAVQKVGKYSLMEERKVPVPTVSASADSQSLQPLFVIVAYLVGGVLLRATISQDFRLQTLMTNFMGGFFVVFSLFKMIDVSGFADGYSTYDILAKRSRAYAIAYPFIELVLGVFYLAGWQLMLVNFITLIVMSIGAVGVVQALLEKRTIQCACLGTALKLPMTKVTLVEDVGMAVMALVMLVVG